MASIQERLVIESNLWWHAYGTYNVFRSENLKEQVKNYKHSVSKIVHCSNKNVIVLEILGPIEFKIIWQIYIYFFHIFLGTRPWPSSLFRPKEMRQWSKWYKVPRLTNKMVIYFIFIVQSNLTIGN